MVHFAADPEDWQAVSDWYLMQHAEENQKYRPTELHVYVLSCLNNKARLGDWDAVTAYFLDLYGSQARRSVGRWVVAARCLRKEEIDLIKEHPEITARMVFDNHFFIGQGADKKKFRFRTLDAMRAAIEWFEEYIYDEHLI